MRYAIAVVLMLAVSSSIGCASGPPPELKYSWEFYKAPTVTASTFTGQSLAILPAKSIEYDPEQEVYRETIAGLLYRTLNKYSPGPKIISLDDVQSAINKNGLWSDVLLMYSEYENSSVLRKDVLNRLGQALDARYVLLPKLLRFQQESFDRATILGISFLRTRQSSVDINAQIWDTLTGEVVWTGASEGSVAAEVVRGKPASFMSVAENACDSLASRMPWVKIAP